MKNLFMSLFLTSCFSFTPGFCSANETTGQDILVYETEKMRLVAAEHSLSRDAVRIESASGTHRFVDWTRQEHQESYELMQKVARVWSARGVEDYLVIGRDRQDGQFGWEMVPFPKEQNAFWKQLNVMKRVFFGEMKRDQGALVEIAHEFQTAYHVFDRPLEANKEDHVAGDDVFCNLAVIEKQKVIDRPEEKVRILYDYRPFAYYHFLAIPKLHEEKFSDVPLETYIKSSQYAQELIKKFGKEGSTAYLFHKTGKRAGQSVPHWHEHIILPNSDSDEFFGKVKVFYNMILGSSPLKPEELQRRVTSLREKLQ